MEIDALRQMIRNSKRILILTHASPDGDAIGAMAALTLVLKQIGKEVKAPIADENVPNHYHFLPIPESNVPLSSNFRPDLAIFLDCESLERPNLPDIVEMLIECEVPIINIDHHSSNTRFGHLDFVDTEAAATSELLYYIFANLNWPTNRDVAECLLTGIVEDTDNFRHMTTTSRTLRIAAELIELGADLFNINEYRQKRLKIADIRLWGELLTRTQTSHDGRLAYTQLTRDLMALLSVDDQSVGSDLVNLLLRIKSADMAILFREKENGAIGVSIRTSPDLDGRKLAKALGGGGHPRAAGAIVQGELSVAVANVLRLVRQEYGIN